FYLPVTGKDELAYQRCSEELRRNKLPLPTLELKDGYNTRQVLNYAYRSWREFFNDRQLLALGWLHAAILELPDDAARAALRAIEYHSSPFELAIERTNGSSNSKRVFGGSAPFSGRVETKWPPPPKLASRAIYLSCGSSASTGLADASVDLVVTDPPFFDNV